MYTLEEIFVLAGVATFILHSRHRASRHITAGNGSYPARGKGILESTEHKT